MIQKYSYKKKLVTRIWQPGVTLNLILSMLVGGTTCKKVSYKLLVDDDKVRTWRGREWMCVWREVEAEEEVGEKKRGVVVSEPHTEESYFRMKADPPKRASFVKAHFSEY